MKTQQVIKLASERSPLKVRSSLLRWEPSSCSLVIKQGGQWRPAVSIFDKVLIQYVDVTDGTFGKRIDRDEFKAFITSESKERLHIFIRPQLPCSVEARTPNRTAMLSSVVDGLSLPYGKRELYWHWAFQYMIIAYCHEVKSAAATLDSKLNTLVTTSAYSQLSQNLATLFNTVSNGRVMNYAADVKALASSLEKIKSDVNTASYGLGVAYSNDDYRKYSRPAISAKQLKNEVGNSQVQVDHYAPKPITVENPDKFMSHWPDLVTILASVGISEPKPYDLTFSEDNLAALASLIDVAKLDYNEPHKWHKATTETVPEESTPVSAMEFA